MNGTPEPTHPPALPGTPIPGARSFPSIEGYGCKCIGRPEQDSRICVDCGLLFMACVKCRPERCPFCQSKR